VHVVAFVPDAGPVPPPIIVVTPLPIAAATCCGEMKWMCVSIAARRDDHVRAAIASVDAPTIMPGVMPSMMNGLPALPMPAMRRRAARCRPCRCRYDR
jgi:hypothetical protein